MLKLFMITDHDHALLHYMSSYARDFTVLGLGIVVLCPGVKQKNVLGISLNVVL